MCICQSKFRRSSAPRAAAAAISASAPFLTILAPPLNYTRFTNQETYCRGLDEDIIDEHFLKLPEIDTESLYKSFNEIECPFS